MNQTSQPPTLLTSAPPRNQWLRPFLTIALIIAVWYAGLLLYDWLMYRGEERVPGVITRPLGPCDIEWFYRRAGQVVLACPHMDMIKLWPLPVEKPWYEDLPVPAWHKVAWLLKECT